MRTTFEERPCLSCVISTAGSSFTTSAASAGAAAAAAGSTGFCTRYLEIFLSILMAAMAVSCRSWRSELAVITFLQRVEEIRGGVFLAVVFDLLVAFHRDLRAVLEREHVGGVLEVVFLDEHALESFGVEAERGAALQALLMGVQIDVLEALVFVIRRHVRCLGDGT